MTRRALFLTLAALALAAPALASEQLPTLAELEKELICPTCHTTLDQSDSPIARRMKAFILARIRAGDTKSEIKQKLVDEFGVGVLAEPPKSGFHLLAWLLPLVGVVGAGAAVGLLAWRWSRSREPAALLTPQPAPTLSPELERRLDDELRRFDPQVASRIPIAFVAGLLSIITPCVLPLVPGYLSAVSAVEATRLGERGVARRVAVSTIPFVLGFTVVFVVLGAGAAAIGEVVSKRAQTTIAGFVLVVLGLAFVGLLPWPERAVAPGLLARARGRGSKALLGGSFAVCAAPCIGTVLAAVLVLASDARTIVRGAILLAAYSVGLGLGFMLAGVAFARAMGAFRWLRDHYIVIRVTSGLTLTALGLLLFFDRDWWLRVLLNRALEKVGLDTL